MKKEECEHYWEFVRTEFVPISYGALTVKEVNRVICHKCGTVKVE